MSTNNYKVLHIPTGTFLVFRYFDSDRGMIDTVYLNEYADGVYEKYLKRDINTMFYNLSTYKWASSFYARNKLLSRTKLLPSEFELLEEPTNV